MNKDIERGSLGDSFEDFLKEQGTYEETTEHAIKRVKAHTANGDQLDHRLKGNGEYQAFVFLTGGYMPRAEEDRKQGDQCAEA